MKTFLKALEKTIFVITALVIISDLSAKAQTVSTFEDLTLAPESYWDGSDRSGKFSNGEAEFYNEYNYNPTTQSGYWAGGFIYSNTTDVETEGYTNPSSAFTGKGYANSSNYIVGYGTSGIALEGPLKGKTISGFFVTNTTYSALSMKNGDQFAKVFGGTSGNDPDWYKLTIKGYLNDAEKNSLVDFYLADFRNSDNSYDYILDSWKWVDLTALGNIDSLSFSVSSSDNSFGFMNTPAYFAIDNFNDPLFAPQVGQPGTTAMHKDSSAFKAWGASCVVTRGPQDISNPSAGDASFGEASFAIGQPGPSTVSLGDGGSAVVTFTTPIANGTGADFAVFENGFTVSGGAFLELAFVEVSSDGSNFFRFPSVSLTDATIQKVNADGLDAKKIHNLAGKYLASYGTPFDLEELKNETGLNVNNITHVRIIDAVGSIDPDYARYDSHGNKINDPWPTAFGSSGFDLDAIGVIHTATSTGIFSAHNDNRMTIYPNPSTADQNIIVTANWSTSNAMTVQVFDYSGQMIKEEISSATEVNLRSSDMASGIYFVKLTSGETVITKKLVIR